MATAIAQIGHNSPPPLESHRLHIEELMAEAQSHLDGEPIANQAQADSVGVLLTMLRQARKGADEQRVVEKKPHDDAAAKVQADWKPLLDRCTLAEQVAKKALVPWLTRQETEARAAAEVARREAEQKAAVARAALSDAHSLADREEAERLLKDASRTDRAASRAEKVKPMAAGEGRAVSLRTLWIASVADSAAALRHYREHQGDALRAWLTEQAQSDVNAGARNIPGITITEERTAQ